MMSKNMTVTPLSSEHPTIGTHTLMLDKHRYKNNVYGA